MLLITRINLVLIAILTLYSSRSRLITTSSIHDVIPLNIRKKILNIAFTLGSAFEVFLH